MSVISEFPRQKSYARTTVNQLPTPSLASHDGGERKLGDALVVLPFVPHRKRWRWRRLRQNGVRVVPRCALCRGRRQPNPRRLQADGCTAASQMQVVQSPADAPAHPALLRLPVRRRTRSGATFVIDTRKPQDTLRDGSRYTRPLEVLRVRVLVLDGSHVAGDRRCGAPGCARCIQPCLQARALAGPAAVLLPQSDGRVSMPEQTVRRAVRSANARCPLLVPSDRGTTWVVRGIRQRMLHGWS